MIGKQALRFTSGSFAYYNLKLHDMNCGLLFAFRAEKGKVEHHCVIVDFYACFCVTEGTANPS